MSIRRCNKCEHPPGVRDFGRRPCECACHSEAPREGVVFIEDWEGMEVVEAVDFWLRHHAKPKTLMAIPRKGLARGRTRSTGG